MEAFLNRGQKDIRLSTDLEDMIYVLDGCRELENKLKAGSLGVHRYLKEQFGKFLLNGQFLDAIQGNLPREDRKNVRYEKLIAFLTRYTRVQAAFP